MIKKTPRKESNKTTLARVKKEMAAPRVAKSARDVVYSVVLNKEKRPLRRDEVETHFKSELSKK